MTIIKIQHILHMSPYEIDLPQAMVSRIKEADLRITIRLFAPHSAEVTIRAPYLAKPYVFEARTYPILREILPKRIQHVLDMEYLK